MSAPEPKYHGFTCPQCGSHKFGTSRFKDETGKNQHRGYCHEDQYTRNGCRFSWDRDNPDEEKAAMYSQTEEEWMQSYYDNQQGSKEGA